MNLGGGVVSGGGGLLLGSSNASSSMAANSNQAKTSNIINEQQLVNLSNKPPLASSANQILGTPQQQLAKQMQTPSTLKSTNVVISATPAIGLHKQLRYEESPSAMLNNQPCELGSFKYLNIQLLLFVQTFSL